jgi:hypothetical protein
MYRYALERTAIPNASLKLLTRLAKTLLKDKSETTNAVIDKAAVRLASCIIEVETAITARIRELNPELVANEGDFDRATDTLWIWLRKLLEGWAAALGHTGLTALSQELQAKADLPALRLRSERARKLHERLFGAEGTSWTQRAYAEQVESMAALLRLIDEDELTAELEFVAGPELPKLLTICQIQYEQMVGDRMSRATSMTDDFRELRAKLRWKIDRYKNAVETLLDDEDPTSDDIVETALRSLILLNQRMAKTSGAATLDEELLGEGLVEFDPPDAPIDAPVDEPIDDEAPEQG